MAFQESAEPWTLEGALIRVPGPFAVEMAQPRRPNIVAVIIMKVTYVDVRRSFLYFVSVSDTYSQRPLQSFRRHHQTRKEDHNKHEKADQARGVHMRRQWQRVLQIDELRPNESIKDDLDGLTTPIHLDTQPDNRRHDPIQDRPEAASHTPDSPTKYSEAEMLVRARPARNDGDESGDDGDTNN